MGYGPRRRRMPEILAAPGALARLGDASHDPAADLLGGRRESGGERGSRDSRAGYEAVTRSTKKRNEAVRGGNSGK